MNGKPILKEKDKKEKTHKIGWWQKKCDTLMQEKGKLLYPKSLLSGQATQVMHHFVPKSVSSRLRYDWDNLIPLTNGEHMRLHQSGDPSYEQRIIEIKGREWYAELEKRRREDTRVNIGYYKQVLQELLTITK